MIEHYTYRAEGHSSSDDPSKYRPLEEADAWPYGDPVERLKQHLIKIGEWSDEQHAELVEELSVMVRETYKEAEALGSIASGTGIDPKTMFEGVYEHMSPKLEEQAEISGVGSWRE